MTFIAVVLTATRTEAKQGKLAEPRLCIKRMASFFKLEIDLTFDKHDVLAARLNKIQECTSEKVTEK